MNTRNLLAITAACMVVLSTLTLGVAAEDTTSTTLETEGSLSAWGGTTTPQTASLFDGGSFSPTENVVTHGSGNPGWYVKLDADDADAFSNLENWINSSDSRTLLHHDRGDSRVLVAAPGDHVRRSSFLGFNVDGLSTRGFVEWVTVEQSVSRADPVTLEDVETVTREYGISRTANLVAKMNGGDFGNEDGTTNGVAYSSDVNKTSMAVVKETIAADADSIPASADGSNVTISVLDTGANVANGEVFGNGSSGSAIRIDHGKNFVTNATINASDGNYSAIADGNLHGTYTAARIAGAGNGTNALRSPAYNAELAVGKVLNDDGSGSIQNIVRGLEWSCSDSVDADVVSMSLGSPTFSKVLEDEIHSCLTEGDVSAVTVAAGNSRWTWGRANIGSPADADGVISVTATTTGEPSDVSVAYFANTGDDGGVLDGSGGHTRGDRPDVGAPGMANTVLIVDSSGPANYTLSGTSMSTPDVAAAAALLIDEHPGLEGDHAAVRDRILATTSPAKKVGVTEIGSGLLNVSNLLADTRLSLDQSAARTEQAAARDNANFAVTGRIGMFLRNQGVQI